jgi:vanillate O-demethylase monooxygenase subunit
MDQEDLTRLLACFWHPVCTLDELSASAPKPLGVKLLGRELAIARLADDESGNEVMAALDDRCLHRSTRLSVGFVDGCAVRCSYHGWAWGGDGVCLDIPALPDGPIPPKARVGAYRAEVHYGLVWVCLDNASTTRPPACPVWGDDSMRVVQGVPYDWPVAAPRRVENFVDLSHFAWVHAGSLGKRDEPVPPLPSITKEEGELRFTYDPPEFDPDSSAMYGFSRYRMPMPCSVNIEFQLETGARRVLWMTASPLDSSHCRTFWVLARSDDIDGSDEPHLAFQRQVLEEDEPVVCNQVPGEFPMNHGEELSVHTDLVSNTYRRWLRELAHLYKTHGASGVSAQLAKGAESVARIEDASDALSQSSSHDASTASSAMTAISSGE